MWHQRTCLIVFQTYTALLTKLIRAQGHYLSLSSPFYSFFPSFILLVFFVLFSFLPSLFPFFIALLFPLFLSSFHIYFPSFVFPFFSSVFAFFYSASVISSFF